ncbi:MAG: hypothetical protein HKO08_12395 [Erythrobacter sp.]|nr:hypothetical protein [Erythrobacter sp.]
METATKTPWHLWVIGIVATLWNAGGAYDYTMTQTRNMDYLTAGAENAGVPVETLVEYYTGFPAWADAFWAFGVWGALAGSLLLLFRTRFAFHAFVVSLLGLIGTTIYTMSAEMPAELASPMMWIFTAAIWLSIILLAWYSRRMTTAGVLK